MTVEVVSTENPVGRGSPHPDAVLLRRGCRPRGQRCRTGSWPAAAAACTHHRPGIAHDRCLLDMRTLFPADLDDPSWFSSTARRNTPSSSAMAAMEITANRSGQGATGTDTDRLAEEKCRALPSSRGLPGLDHDGTKQDRGCRATKPSKICWLGRGIDLTCWSSPRDEGVMPQTAEHLDILSLLGVQGGCGATKAELVDDDH